LRRPDAISENTIQYFLEKEFKDTKDMLKYFDEHIAYCIVKFGKDSKAIKEWEYMKWRVQQKQQSKEVVQFT
jgi:hypothetical protein